MTTKLEGFEYIPCGMRLTISTAKMPVALAFSFSAERLKKLKGCTAAMHIERLSGRATRTNSGSSEQCDQWWALPLGGINGANRDISRISHQLPGLAAKQLEVS